jgi:hypothetical protein
VLAVVTLFGSSLKWRVEFLMEAIQAALAFAVEALQKGEN